MHHQYRKPGRASGGRRPDALIAIGLAVVVAVVTFLVIASRDHSPDSTLALPPLPATTPSTTTPGTLAPTTTTAPVVVAPPADTTGNVDGRDAVPSVTGSALADPNDPQAALALEADRSSAVEVTDVIPIGSTDFAMMSTFGGARLLRWDGVEWIDQGFLDTPAPVRSIEVEDVTGDGSPEFVVLLSGVDRQGGVYGRPNFSFDWMPFSTGDGTTDFVDNLQLNLGTLRSNPPVRTATSTVRWAWNGSQFVAR